MSAKKRVLAGMLLLSLSLSLLVIVAIPKNAETGKNVIELRIKNYIQTIIVPEKVAKSFISSKSRHLTRNFYGQDVEIYLPESFTKKGKDYILNLPNLKNGAYAMANEDYTLKLIVGPKKENVPEITLENCDKLGLSTKEDCFATYFIDRYKRDGDLNKILEDIANSKETTPTLASFCHIVTHDIGIYYMLTKHHLEDVTSPHINICNNGFVHGAEEGLALAYTNKEIKEIFPILCDRPIFQKIGNCNHGLGHLAYYRAGNFTKSMALCNLLKENKRYSEEVIKNDIINCADGVSMSYIIDYGGMAQSKEALMSYEVPLEVIDPIVQCESLVEESLVIGCLSNVNWYYTEDAIPVLKKNCDTMRDLPLRYCYISLGRIGGTYLTYQETGKLCASKFDIPTSACLAQAASWYYYMFEKNPNHSDYYCNLYKSRPKVCEFIRYQEKTLTP